MEIKFYNSLSPKKLIQIRDFFYYVSKIYLSKQMIEELESNDLSYKRFFIFY